MHSTEAALNRILASCLNAAPEGQARAEVVLDSNGCHADIQFRHARGPKHYQDDAVLIAAKIGTTTDTKNRAIKDAQRLLKHPRCHHAIALCYPGQLSHDSAPEAAMGKPNALHICHVTPVTRTGRWQKINHQQLRKQMPVKEKPQGNQKTKPKSIRRKTSIAWRRTARRTIQYRSAKHADLPHIVKFSGGRSSGMLLGELISSRLLQPSRGDLIIFCNTGAEHPATYNFVHRCRVNAEKAGIPFLALEYATYETPVRGVWQRKPTYRLVRTCLTGNARKGRTPDSWDTTGAVFEEMLSHTGSMPSNFNRTCTEQLKIRTAARAIQDWAQGQLGIPAQGLDSKHPKLTDEQCYEQHQRHGGESPRKVLLTRRRFVRQRPWYRPAQEYENFTIVPQPQMPWPNYEHVALIGIRHDEQGRALKFLTRAQDLDAANHVPGENPYCPLLQWHVTQPQVYDYWQKQTWNLMDHNTGPISNCTFCFMKGKRELRELAARMPQPNGHVHPEHLQWWIDMDDRYARNQREEGRAHKSGKHHLGFFGASDHNGYRELQQGNVQDIPDETMPCHCTD